MTEKKSSEYNSMKPKRYADRWWGWRNCWKKKMNRNKSINVTSFKTSTPGKQKFCSNAHACKFLVKLEAPAWRLQFDHHVSNFCQFFFLKPLEPKSLDTYHARELSLLVQPTILTWSLASTDIKKLSIKGTKKLWTLNPSCSIKNSSPHYLYTMTFAVWPSRFKLFPYFLSIFLKALCRALGSRYISKPKEWK